MGIGKMQTHVKITLDREDEKKLESILYNDIESLETSFENTYSIRVEPWFHNAPYPEAVLEKVSSGRYRFDRYYDAFKEVITLLKEAYIHSRFSYDIVSEILSFIEFLNTYVSLLTLDKEYVKYLAGEESIIPLIIYDRKDENPILFTSWKPTIYYEARIRHYRLPDRDVELKIPVLDLRGFDLDILTDPYTTGERILYMIRGFLLYGDEEDFHILKQVMEFIKTYFIFVAQLLRAIRDRKNGGKIEQLVPYTSSMLKFLKEKTVDVVVDFGKSKLTIPMSGFTNTLLFSDEDETPIGKHIGELVKSESDHPIIGAYKRFIEEVNRLKNRVFSTGDIYYVVYYEDYAPSVAIVSKKGKDTFIKYYDLLPTVEAKKVDGSEIFENTLKGRRYTWVVKRDGEIRGSSLPSKTESLNKALYMIRDAAMEKNDEQVVRAIDLFLLDMSLR